MTIFNTILAQTNIPAKLRSQYHVYLTHSIVFR